MRKVLACLLFVCAVAYGQGDRWAVVVGITDYPRLSQEFSPVTSAAKDAAAVAACLTSVPCRFSPANVILLSDSEATLAALRHVLRQRLAAIGRQDTLVFFFAGHGWHDTTLHRFNLLLHEADGRGTDDTLPIEQLADMLQALVPAGNVLLCLDARRSRQALGDAWYAGQPWQRCLASDHLCMLEASSPQEIARERGNYGLFAYFLCKALQGKSFLAQTADANGDGFITAGELQRHVCWAMQFSGISQHPLAAGDSRAVLTRLFDDTPHLQFITPLLLKSPATSLHCAGFVRCTRPVARMTVGDKEAQLVALSTAQIARYDLLAAPYTYWFAADTPVISGSAKLAVQTEVDGVIYRHTMDIGWSYAGWYGEWMPPGLRRGEQSSIYVWQQDGSEMVYVPEGACILGVSDAWALQLAGELKEIGAYLGDRKTWLQQDAVIRREISAGLEQSNETIRQIAQRLKSIYKRVETFDQVNRLSRANEQREKPVADDNMPPSPLQENLFLALSYDLLYRCYRDLGAVEAQERELAQTLAFIEDLQRPGILERVMQAQQIRLPAFYLDRQEICNRQYMRFCEATARHYPASPWWDESYLFSSPDHPVIHVSWEDATAYACWAGKRLPAADEWEKSVRGDRGMTFPWGDLLPNQSRVHADVPPPLTLDDQFPLPMQMPVAVDEAHFPLSVYGCRHLAGNVQEWCADVPLAWKKMLGPATPDYRLARGGSFASPALLLAGWFAHPFPPTARRCDLGFRCALSGLTENK